MSEPNALVPSEHDAVPADNRHSDGATDAGKLVPRPRSERKSIADMLGRWPGEVDDGFEEFVREHRRGGAKRHR